MKKQKQSASGLVADKIESLLASAQKSLPKQQKVKPDNNPLYVLVRSTDGGCFEFCHGLSPAEVVGILEDAKYKKLQSRDLPFEVTPMGGIEAALASLFSDTKPKAAKKGKK